jgi:hypothetical protein
VLSSKQHGVHVADDAGKYLAEVACKTNICLLVEVNGGEIVLVDRADGPGAGVVGGVNTLEESKVTPA